jgi:hypothetical protein
MSLFFINVLSKESRSISHQRQATWVSYHTMFRQLYNLDRGLLKSSLKAMQQRNTLVRLFMRNLLIIVSGGFATIQPGNLLSINAVEAYSIEDFSAEAVRSGLADAQRVASGSGSEEEVAEARIEVEVYEALQVRPRSMNLLTTRLLE